ncbi:major facilitator superfamily domain-containing protein [Aspergillus pseudotamarii]|uniref:Major facilitator superfamily domain-containing protein n=1 Tax=Aspergillus pseudotamarii TaxID=132259 RepID=A0A5N6SVZ6_ASPPS|nr:major facilitator superfamily domain-containing protein [Aspergillus pseudotamarii]KAE8137951.1 major facilitator superfamily domain-containing protein [Aspergillus pseudotamarii]
MANVTPLEGLECLEHCEHDVERDYSLSQQEKRPITGIKWFLLVASTLTGSFLYALDNTIVANIAPVIVNHFESVEDLPWMSVGFMIGAVAMVLIVGKLYTLYNAKWLYIVFTVIFVAASALCGAAPTINAEIVGRVFAGVGGNGMYIGVLTLLSLNTTSRERPQYLSLTGLVWGLGTVLGPVIGGGFELYTWRWAFYINLLFAVILLPLYFFVIPSNSVTPGLSLQQKLNTFDWVGAILSVAAFTTLVMGINFGGTLYNWDAAQIIALFILSGILWITFVAQQSFAIVTAFERRIFPIHLLKQKEPALLFIACASAGIVTYSSVYYIPIYFQYTKGDNAIISAVRLLPFICMLVVAIQGSGIMMSRVGYYKPWYLAGSALALIPAVLMSTIVETHTSPSVLYGLELVLGLGAGLYSQAAFAVIQAVTPPSDSVDGLTLMILAQLTGLTLGLSITGAIFVNVAQNRLYELLPKLPRAQVSRIVSGTSSGLLSTLPRHIREQALDIIVLAWRDVFTCVYVGAAISLVCAIFLANKRANIMAGAGGA